MVEILCGRSSGRPDAGTLFLKLDATLAEDAQYKNKVTSYPVENGLDVSDNVRQEPDEINIEGIVSDTPDANDMEDGQWSASAYQILCAIAGRAYVSNLSDTIQDEYPQPIMVDLVCHFRVFTDMICEVFDPPRTPTTGDALHFTAHFKKVRKANVNMALINLANKSISDRAQAKVDQGKNETTPPKTEEQTSADYLRSHGFGWLADLLGK